MPRMGYLNPCPGGRGPPTVSWLSGTHTVRRQSRLLVILPSRALWDFRAGKVEEAEAEDESGSRRKHAGLCLCTKESKEYLKIWISNLNPLSVRLFVCLSVRPFVRPSFHPFVRPSICSSVHPFLRPSVCPFFRQNHLLAQRALLLQQKTAALCRS